MTMDTPAREARRTRRMQHRLLTHHAPLLAGGAVSLAILVRSIHGDNLTHRLSMASAYVSLALLGATLAIGALRAIRNQLLPLSLDLRRDVGIWAAIIAIVHTAVGLFVHLGNPLLYFFRPPGPPASWAPRVDAFGATNYAGIVATCIVALLLATSNDASIRTWGAARWKTVHRWVYIAAALVVLHGAVYQVLEHRTLPLVVTFVAMVVLTAALQWRGFVARRARQTARSHAPRQRMM